MKIICMGDSITYGFGLPDLSKRWSDLVSARTGHTLINRGVSGDTTGGMLARCQTQVFHQAPDAMVLLGGINDISITGQYRPVCANVVAICRQAELLSIPVILGVPLPIFPADMCPPEWDPEQDMARTAAGRAIRPLDPPLRRRQTFAPGRLPQPIPSPGRHGGPFPVPGRPPPHRGGPPEDGRRTVPGTGGAVLSFDT